MAEVASNLTDFSSTTRTGRRNALPDILDVGSQPVTGEDLVGRLDSLSIDGKGAVASGGTEAASGPSPSTSTEQSDAAGSEGS